MSRLPLISGRECMKALQRLGFEVIRQTGSHIILQRGEITVSVPDHKELGRGILRAIIRQTGLTVEEFVVALND